MTASSSTLSAALAAALTAPTASAAPSVPSNTNVAAAPSTNANADLTPLYYTDQQLSQMLKPNQDQISPDAMPPNLQQIFSQQYAQTANQQDQSPAGYAKGGLTPPPGAEDLLEHHLNNDEPHLEAALLNKFKPQAAPPKEDMEDTLSQYDTPEGHQYLHDLAQHKAKGGLLVNTAPTDGQKDAGNYRKGHIRMHGMHISIENPKGSERKGKGRDGHEWKVTMPVHYGYIKRTEGADGDHVDVSVGDHPAVEHVHIIDQIDPDTKKFDEHKVMMGFPSMKHAVHAYRDSFSDGRGHERIGSVTPMHVNKFKEWVQTHHAKKPLGDHFRKGGRVKSVISRFCDDSTIDTLRGVGNG